MNMSTAVLDKCDLVSKSHSGDIDSPLDIQMINNNNENPCNNRTFQLPNDTNDVPNDGTSKTEHQQTVGDVVDLGSINAHATGGADSPLDIQNINNNNENPCNNRTFQLPNYTNDVPNDGTSKSEHQQTVEDESDLGSNAGSDSYSFETANDVSDNEMDENDTEMLTATSFSGHQQTAVDETKLETNDGNDVLDPTGTLV